ncbi:MAG: 50S ribosomal protein L32 [Candidatus Babeliales bacterium]
MPEPKRKRSRARRDSRFANKAMDVKFTGLCANCQSANLPHQVCKNCGFYRGAKVMTTKLDRALKRGQARPVDAAAGATDIEA